MIAPSGRHTPGSPHRFIWVLYRFVEAATKALEQMLRLGQGVEPHLEPFNLRSQADVNCRRRSAAPALKGCHPPALACTCPGYSTSQHLRTHRMHQDFAASKDPGYSFLPRPVHGIGVARKKEVLLLLHVRSRESTKLPPSRRMQQNGKARILARWQGYSAPGLRDTRADWAEAFIMLMLWPWQKAVCICRLLMLPLAYDSPTSTSLRCHGLLHNCRCICG